MKIDIQKVWIVDLESVETRYTCQWKTHLPKLLNDEGFLVRVVEGATDIPPATTPGAFLNFGGTNIYKSTQMEKLSRAFTEGEVKDGDHIIFTDAWHPGIINVKYMAELLGIKVITHGLWHAGSYDPADFLGRLIGDTPWVRHAERSMFESFDHNYFATDFHIKLFGKSHTFKNVNDKVLRSGWPMEYMKDTLKDYKGMKKRDLILFPHRIAPEKQPEIFRDLANSLPEYEFVVCQDKQLTKEEYHKLLGEAKMVFSANTQETLGISPYEGILVGAMPLVPDRLSYTEMYDDIWKYNSDWTKSYASYEINKQKLVNMIKDDMQNYDNKLPKLKDLEQKLTDMYFSATNLLNNIHSYGKEEIKETKEKSREVSLTV
tara:strand:- start:1041 stop:2165 length:1125 start_codon:yes stop_codon:yes gene_type:complete